MTMEHHCLRPCPALQQCLNAVKNKLTKPSSGEPDTALKQSIIEGTIVIDHKPGHSGPGKSASVQIYSGTIVDKNTGKGKLSEKAYLKRKESHKRNGTRTTTYTIKVNVEPEFGIPGAFIIENQHKHEFFIESATLQAPENLSIYFDCRSWVYPMKHTQTSRIFFSNKNYLPSQTPFGLVDLREEELEDLRGDTLGERKEWHRVYGYDYYNDLGDPDKDPQLFRPTIGGTEFPYPRRGKTGRRKCQKAPFSERRTQQMNFDVYVPPDERFSPKKLSEFTGNAIQAIVHFVIPEAKSLLLPEDSSFQSFREIKELFTREKGQKVEEGLIEKLRKVMPEHLVKKITHASKGGTMKFPMPSIAIDNEFAWREDEEFGRQMLAGTNPTRIRCIEQFPLKGKHGEIISSIKESDIENSLDGQTIIQAMKQWRIYILDHHDYLMPYLDKINSKGNVCAYASRTLVYLRNDATVKPLAIELSLPESEDYDGFNKVYHPAKEGTDAALWQLAKAHVLANDSAYHQLVTHWLHTHAVVEPFIIGMKRQLSTMHPIYRLLDPHFKDTMHINALARSILINAGGILENILFPGEICMQLSSELYKEWRLDEQGLPIDLLKRRLALENEDNLTGVQILFQDYPYGLDGLDIYAAIQTWVVDYCSIFYKDDETLRKDDEVQEWWSEVRNIGHADKWTESWWTELTNVKDLTRFLTILIWITSGLHAAVNFGQYAYAGYPLNRPTLCRKFIPQEGTMEFSEFLKDTDKYFLQTLPNRFQSAISIALAEVLSRHTSDELYLGQRPPTEWTDHEEVLHKYEEFKKKLKEIEETIMERNRNPKYKNRLGPAKIPYKLLNPDSSNDKYRGGITEKGIPNSISI
ncbi:probable linoleate 9S-lipoxygenase 5 [Pistacia vera]|uniref:probable linoleate 9S-lipoxygenase 5 n=1 Tax=Pistacia vera TaxID=55513 RepID=UPI001263A51F|nr:probable linoleate 9S-lipoxygenase 5 [Pistacia vera]